MVAFFSGGAGLGLKIVLLAIVNAIAIWAAVILASDEKWIALGVLVAATLAIDLIYLSPRRAIPLKFLVPGTVFLIAFQIIPIVYTSTSRSRTTRPATSSRRTRRSPRSS